MAAQNETSEPASGNMKSDRLTMEQAFPILVSAVMFGFAAGRASNDFHVGLATFFGVLIALVVIVKN